MDCITVLLATYNQKEYIYQAIDSVLMQNYPKIQLIVSDDGSSYFSSREVEEYICKKNRGNLCDVIVNKNTVNLGTVKNLNEARQYIKGKYVVLLSGDDLFYDEQVLEKYVQGFENEPETEVLVSQVVHYDEAMEAPLFFCLNQEQIALLKSGDNRLIYAKVCTGCFIPAIGTAYRKELMDKIGAFDERYFLVEDWPYYLKMLREGARINYIDFISAKHRDGGVSHVKRNRKEERSDRYHKDLICIIKNEIYPNYQFATPKLQKEVYNYANDRIVISEFRSEFRSISFNKKIHWVLKNKNLPAIFIRGCVRRINDKKN